MRTLKLLLSLAALVLVGVPATVQAVEPIEGLWVSGGATVLVSPQGPAELHGVAVSQHPQLGCVTPGTELWPSIKGGAADIQRYGQPVQQQSVWADRRDERDLDALDSRASRCSASPAGRRIAGLRGPDAPRSVSERGRR